MIEDVVVEVVGQILCVRLEGLGHVGLPMGCFPYRTVRARDPARQPPISRTLAETRWLSTSVYVVKGGGERSLKAREHVTIRAERDLDGAVAEAFHDRPRISTIGDEHRGVAMSKVVKSCLGRETGAEDRWPEVASVEVGVSERPAS